jgi:hypothetical protein
MFCTVYKNSRLFWTLNQFYVNFGHLCQSLESFKIIYGKAFLAQGMNQMNGGALKVFEHDENCMKWCNL